MPRPRDDPHGPGFDSTVEIGDVFMHAYAPSSRRYLEGHCRFLTVVGKRYENDMSITYLCTTTGGRHGVSKLNERTLNRWGREGYRRIYKTPRRLMAYGTS